MTDLILVVTYCRGVIRTRAHDQRGASVIEYAFLAALIVVVCIGAMTMVGGATGASLSQSADKLP